MPSFTLTRAIVLAAFAALAVKTVSGHGFTTMPRMRGAMNTRRSIPNPVLDSTAPTDTCAHCLNCGGPASVGGPWKLFSPFEYQRSGITLCGDPVGSDAHSKTGKFANTARMPFAAKYKPGSVVNFEYDITANHKGFLTFYLCDVSAGGDVENTVAFFKANCHELKREPHVECEAGGDKTCGPIDPKYPTRFVVPCGGGDLVFGGDNGKMAYRIPDVEMKEAVVVTYWMTANSCSTPDGFLQRYNYPSAWGGCGTPGTGLSNCGGMVPEEFFHCSDVSVSGSASGAAKPTEAIEGTETPTTVSAASTSAPTAAPNAALTTVNAGPADTPTEAPDAAAYAAAQVTIPTETPTEVDATAGGGDGRRLGRRGAGRGRRAAPAEVPMTVAPYDTSSEAQDPVDPVDIPYAGTIAPTEAAYISSTASSPSVETTEDPYVAVETTASAAVEIPRKPVAPASATVVACYQSCSSVDPVGEFATAP